MSSKRALGSSFLRHQRILFGDGQRVRVRKRFCDGTFAHAGEAVDEYDGCVRHDPSVSQMGQFTGRVEVQGDLQAGTVLE